MRLTKDGKRYIIRDHVAAVIVAALALGFAGTLQWKNAWLYGCAGLLLKLLSAVVLSRANPAVLNARGARKQMSKRERTFFSVFIPASFAVPIVAGLDVGAPGWTHRSGLELGVGLTLMILGFFFVIWALAVNEHFEPTVRLQTDRDHRVCTAGPYRIVRHPGYVGAIVAGAGVPFVLGSMWCFAPFYVTFVALVVRTGYEDRMLRAELVGYEGYAQTTRFRLLPYVW